MFAFNHENKGDEVKRIISRAGIIAGLAWGSVTGAGLAGELTVDGNMVVKTNLVVNGQLSSGVLALTNLTIVGEAVIQRAVIQHLPPQGDLGMGPDPNGVAH